MTPAEARKAEARRKRVQWEQDQKQHAFPKLKMGQQAWKFAVRDYMAELAQELPYGSRRKALRRKADFMPWCGSRARVRECGDCGTPRARSGVLTPESMTNLCGSRACPTCSRIRANKTARQLSYATTLVPDQRNWGWKLVTITMQRDPLDPGAHTVDALRNRMRMVHSTWRELWSEGLKQPAPGAPKRSPTASAAFWAIEMSGTGNVHLHCLYFGPYIAKEWAQRVSHMNGTGNIDLRSIEGDERSRKDACREVAKYCSASLSPLSEDWIAGRKRVVMNPELVARFEAASHGVHLRGVNGVLFGKMSIEEAVGEDDQAQALEAAEDDAELHCECCGVVGRFETQDYDATAAVRYFHALDQPALFESRWTPFHKDGTPRARGPTIALEQLKATRWQKIDVA